MHLNLKYRLPHFCAQQVPGMGTLVVQNLWPSGNRVKTLVMPLSKWGLQVKFFDLYGLDLYGTVNLDVAWSEDSR